MKNYIHTQTLVKGLLVIALMAGALIPVTLIQKADASTVCEKQIHNESGRPGTYGNPNMMKENATNTVKATFAVPATDECKAQIRRDGGIKITLASYCAPNGTDGRPYHLQKYIAHQTIVVKKTGSERYTMRVPVPANQGFYQVDLARGDVLYNFNTTTYANPNQPGGTRLLHARHGGYNPCLPAPAKPAAPAPAKPVAPKPVAPTATPSTTNICSNVNSPNGMACNETVTTVVNEQPKPEAPAAEKQTPGKLPETGVGGTLAAFFGATSFGSMIYYAFARRFGSL